MKKGIVFAIVLLVFFTSIINAANLCSAMTTLKANHENKKPPKTGLKSDTIHVLNYAIHLDIIHLSNKTIRGYTELTITPKMNNINAIPLDLLALSVDSVKVKNQLVPAFAYNDTLLRIPLSLPVGTQDTVSLKVYYHGQPVEDQPPTGWGGFYFSSDSAFAYNLGISLYNIPHNYGKVWFPCIDDFIDRATYDCYIRVDSSKTAVCDGTLMQMTNNGDGTKTYYWRLHNTIPTYLASVAVGNYIPVSMTFAGMNGNIPVKIYVPPSDTAKAKASFVNLLNILGVYENNFGPYMWERVGYVGVPFNNGAMEHATNIAYPLAVIDGSITYEELYAHELSHHWFGDLVTCASAEDMWLNEGWATFCESFFREGIYGKAAYQANVDANHYYSLNNCHIDDGGYYAIYGIPENLTYGSTVYKTGADVVHTLRNYLGDSLFFSFIKAYTNTYQYNHINSYQFRDFISAHTGINMNDFFDGWVFSPGFSHFSIDSVVYTGTGNDYMVYVKQKLLHKPNYVNSNKVEITFMNANWQQYTESIAFSGEYGSKLFHLPFAPVAAMMDLNEKVSDATTDYSKVIKATSNISFSNSFFLLEVQSITDSAFFRIEHNWVAPDPLKTPSPDIFRISQRRYWKVDGIFPSGFSANGRFSYSRTSNGFETDLLPAASSTDSLVLLYRKNAADDWKLVNFTKVGNSTLGSLTTTGLQKGEYTFGIGKPFQSGIIENNNKKSLLKVYPNPSNDTFNILANTDKNAEIKIFDAASRLVYKAKVAGRQKLITWRPSSAKSGTYFVHLYENGKEAAVERVVFVR